MESYCLPIKVRDMAKPDNAILDRHSVGHCCIVQPNDAIFDRRYWRGHATSAFKVVSNFSWRKNIKTKAVQFG